jgi:glycosyltransferase involved in cell wall biosynthesis
VTLERSLGEIICQNCDIILSTSDSDANPTTLLEGTAWGLIPACTRESGYYNDPIFTTLSLEDMGHNVRVLSELLRAPSQELRERSLAGRRAIETRYTWENFCNRVWAELCSYL